MFSSNPFPYLPSSTNLFLPPPNSNSFFDHHQKDDFHLNFHQRINEVVGDPFISGDYFLHSGNTTATTALIPPPVIMENVTTIKQDFVQLQQHQFSQEDLLDSVICRYKKKSGTSKKHGHSKICTARGPRDRRVRFSIEVAQKFFSLQDLLGFDKASKTLDWLLTNSMPAIKELIQETDDCSSSSLTHQYKLKFLEAINGGSANDEKKNSVLVPKSSCVVANAGKKKKTRRKCSKSGFIINGARHQSRAEARARARERTKEKMRVKKLDDDLKLKTLLVPDGCGSDLTLKSADCWTTEIDQPQIDYKNISNFE